MRRYPGSELSVIQYASMGSGSHHYSVSVPFTTLPTTARTWSRAYGAGGTVATYYQDHLPGSMYQMRNNNIWDAGGTVDLVTGGCNVRMFLFTDALSGSTGTGCCSHLTSVSAAVAPLALADFGEYNLHKTTYNSQWTVYHVNSSVLNRAAGAAIASKGGGYTGTIAANPGDPQGAGGPRKFWWSTTFTLTQPDIDTALANINAGSFSASFPNDTICLGDTAHFASNILFPTSLIYWDFGDGNIDTTNTAPSHVYSGAGTYNVTLIAWSADSSCKDTVVKPVVIHPPLVPNFTFDTVCYTNRTTFTNTTSGYISSLLWKFGDGAMSTFSPDTTHLYALPGAYQVTLIVNSSNICQDSITREVIVNDLPGADFNVINQCQYLDVSPTNTTTVITAAMSSLSWDWDFGDGATAGTQSPTHAYTTPGTYNIEMIVETLEGCSDTVVKPIVIDPRPIPNFSADTACLHQFTSFTDLSTVSSGAITNWLWGLPTGASTQNTTYTFPIDGTFPVTLTITTDSVCSADTTISVVVRPLPSPDFNFSPQEIFTFDTKVCFVNTSTNAVSYLWDFDFTGGTSNVPAPCTITFPNNDEGNYNVKLVATNQYGCKDSIYKEVSILEGFILYAPSAFTPNGDGKNDFFKIHAEGIVEFELLIFNRWGEEIFRTTDENEVWEGKFKGDHVKTDTYVYRVFVKSKNNKTQEFHGHVNLLR